MTRNICLIAILFAASLITISPAQACGVRAFGWRSRPSTPTVDFGEVVDRGIVYCYVRVRHPLVLAGDALVGFSQSLNHQLFSSND